MVHPLLEPIFGRREPVRLLLDNSKTRIAGMDSKGGDVWNTARILGLEEGMATAGTTEPVEAVPVRPERP